MPERAARAEMLRASSPRADFSREAACADQLRMIAPREEEREVLSSWIVCRYCASQERPTGDAFSRRERPSRRVSLLFVKGTRTRVEPV